MPDTPAYGSDYELVASLLRRVQALEQGGGGGGGIAVPDLSAQGIDGSLSTSSSIRSLYLAMAL